MRRALPLILIGIALSVFAGCGEKTKKCENPAGEEIPCPDDNPSPGDTNTTPSDSGTTPSDSSTTPPDSCKGICGDANNKGPCGCDLQCLDWGDCCWDFATACKDYINGGPSDVDAGTSTPDAGGTDSGSTTPDYTFPSKFIPGELSKEDCMGIASHNMTWCTTTQCKGIASWNYSWCDGHGDCKGIAAKNYTYCDSKDCRGIAEAYKCVDTHKGDDDAIANCREQASNKHCSSKDCRGIAKDDFSWCGTAACKAIVKKDKSFCSQL